MSWLLFALRLLGLASWAEGLYARYEARKAGRAEQRAADDAASIKRAESANAVETDVARDSDAQLDSELRQFSRDGQ